MTALLVVLAVLLGRPVLLELHAGWCAACRVVDAGTLRDPRVRRLPLVRIDISDDDEPARRLGITALPAFVVLRADGRRTTLVGTVTPEELLRAAAP